MARLGSSVSSRVLLATLVLGAGVTAADAKCARLAFSVNDYGKDGPTKDAIALLDKHIASWTAARGITKYAAGKKDVKCELFLDFGFFDEHTCKASATVCWADGPGVQAKPNAASPAKAARPVAPIEKAPAPKTSPSEAPAAPGKAKPKSA